MTWTIDTDPDGALTAELYRPPSPTPTRGETLNPVFRFRAAQQSDYETLEGYLEYVGHVATGTESDGHPYYRELQTDPRSMLMQFSPDESIPTVSGYWGVVVDGSVTTELPPADLGIQLRVFYLAEASDYASHGDVRNVFEE